MLALPIVAGLSLKLGLPPATWMGVATPDLLAEPALLVLPVTVVAARVARRGAFPDATAARAQRLRLGAPGPCGSDTAPARCDPVSS
ncbi:hypothetical protein AB0903_04830 [Streptomyces sp. NPDC048389]|uniref:hypothetical protein n=1 Tax=Streptomyces sp. NPDC048389 TaxID=3154622 RepID=UPI0034543DD2